MQENENDNESNNGKQQHFCKNFYLYYTIHKKDNKFIKNWVNFCKQKKKFCIVITHSKMIDSNMFSKFNK